MATRELELSSDPVAEPIVELIAFFSEHLGEVSFPDLDQGTLDATTLDQLADKVRRGAAEVQRARKALEEANLALAAARDELDTKALRALGYARVFCEGQEQLAEQVAALSLGGTKKKPKKRAAAPEEAAKPKKRAAKKKAGEPLPLEAKADPVVELEGDADASDDEPVVKAA